MQMFLSRSNGLGAKGGTTAVESWEAISGGFSHIFPANGLLGWNGGSGGSFFEPSDTGISRDSAGVFDFGNGGFQDKSATLQAAVVNLGAMVLNVIAREREH